MGNLWELPEAQATSTYHKPVAHRRWLWRRRQEGYKRRREGYCGQSIKSGGGTSLAVQWLGFCASTSGGPGSIPGLGTKTPQATRHSSPPLKKKSWGETVGQQRLTGIAFEETVVGGQVKVEGTVASHDNSTQFINGSETRQCLQWLTRASGVCSASLELCPRVSPP